MTRMRTGCCHPGQDDTLLLFVELRMRLIELDISELISSRIFILTIACLIFNPSQVCGAVAMLGIPISGGFANMYSDSDSVCQSSDKSLMDLVKEVNTSTRELWVQFSTFLIVMENIMKMEISGKMMMRAVR